MRQNSREIDLIVAAGFGEHASEMYASGILSDFHVPSDIGYMISIVKKLSQFGFAVGKREEARQGRSLDTRSLN